MDKKTVGISLGFNCDPAIFGVNNNIRSRKADGYLTCPFDECNSYFGGVIECIRDDFKDFFNPEYLQLIEIPFDYTIIYIQNINKWVVYNSDDPDHSGEHYCGGYKTGEKIIYNTKYKMMFIHESPDHANLYSLQNWPGGKNHFVDNAFALFKERYGRRIENFQNYLRSDNNIHFILSRYNQDMTLLDEILKNKYPTLEYKITILEPNFVKSALYEHYKLMFVEENDIKNEL